MIHVTHIDGPDIAGHWGWHCICGSEVSGYEWAAEVLAAAEKHGPLAADATLPRDDPDQVDDDQADDPDDLAAALDETQTRRAVAGRVFARTAGVADVGDADIRYRMIRARVGNRLVERFDTAGRLIAQFGETPDGWLVEATTSASVLGPFGDFATAVDALEQHEQHEQHGAAAVDEPGGWVALAEIRHDVDAYLRAGAVTAAEGARQTRRLAEAAIADPAMLSPTVVAYLGEQGELWRRVHVAFAEVAARIGVAVTTPSNLST